MIPLNDGDPDLFVGGVHRQFLYRNDGGRFVDVTAAAGLASDQWVVGAGWFDYDGDGRLDLFVVNYVRWSPAFDRFCGDPVRKLRVYCHPRYFEGRPNTLYRNRGDGTFEDVSERSGITKASGTYGLGVSTLDFDDDGWVDAYVANDSNPSALYRNNHDGTFTDMGVAAGCAYSQDGKPQAGMGVAIGDYDRNGTMDIFKTNFAGDTSTLYSNTGDGFCEDKTFASGIGR